MADAVIERPAPINRREFLFYIWGASMALTLAGSAGAVLWFAYPRFREGEFGGQFTVSASTLPAAGSGPQENAQGRFWLVNTDRGVLAIYKVCTHLGCLYKWTPSNDRFECPCHGSKFQKDGTYIEGPAPRSLDRFVVQAVDARGAVLAETLTGDANADPAVGGPLALPAGTVEVKIDTGKRVEGPRHG
jgi:cytochrome b6-f complex iron-sulfur subunit